MFCLETAMPHDDRYEHYEIVKRADGMLWEVNRNGRSVTYKAFDTHLHRPVALKVMNAVCLESETARHRFLDEARAAGALRHQNVASVFHLGMDHDNYFYAMEFVDGQTIDKYMRQKGTLTPLEALDIAVQVTRALAAAAKQGLVHPDLRPANLMLVDEEGEKVVKVMDFGLAKRVERESEESASFSVDGAFLGTPHVASPEQLEERDFDIRSNIYSLGATLYYLVTGRPPFSGSVGQIMSQHLNRPVPTGPLQGHPPSFVKLIVSMMEKNPDKRPQSAKELREKIRNCIRELSEKEMNRSHSGVMSALSRLDTAPTLVLAPLSKGTLTVGSVFVGKYRVDETLPDNAAAKCYRGVDLERQLNVRLLVLSHEYLADAERSTTLKKAANQVRKAPHSGLRQIIALETVGNQIVLVEEFLSAPSLLEILRTRELLSPAEVVAALKPLAAVADHALRKQLEYVDFTLGGIQLFDSAQGKDRADIEELIRKPLTKWSELTPLVAPIDFAFGCDSPPTWAGRATVVQSFRSFCRQKDSYIRQLSLLAYELLGGPRSTLETRGRYTPLAALSEEGNHVLRRGLVGEVATASDLADALAACLTDGFVDDFVCAVPAASAD
jgi:hypothetical protein